MKHLLFLITCVFFTITFEPVHAQKAGIEDEILVLINKHRTSMGLAKLEMNGFISTVAATHSKAMANKRTAFGHDGFNGRVKKISSKISHLNAWAENVAFGADDAKGVVKMWLNSKGHRKNIEGRYSITGIGIARSPGGTLYFTQIFVMKK